jgi:hypothetical protein
MSHKHTHTQISNNKGLHPPRKKKKNLFNVNVVKTFMHPFWQTDKIEDDGMQAE